MRRQRFDGNLCVAGSVHPGYSEAFAGFSLFLLAVRHTLETYGECVGNRFDLDEGPQRKFEISINLRLAARVVGGLVLVIWGLVTVFGPSRWMIALTSRPVMALLILLVLFLLKC